MLVPTLFTYKGHVRGQMEAALDLSSPAVRMTKANEAHGLLLVQRTAVARYVPSHTRTVPCRCSRP